MSINADSLRVGRTTFRGYVKAAPSWRSCVRLSRTGLKVVTCARDNGHETCSGATATPPVVPCHHHKFTLHGLEQRLWTFAADVPSCLWMSLHAPLGIRIKLHVSPDWELNFILLFFSEWTHQGHLSPTTKLHVALVSEWNFTYLLESGWNLV